jgi:uncharacterized protein (DUF885 family)
MASSSKILQDEMKATWQWRIETDPELAASTGMLSIRRSTHVLDPRSLDSFAMRLSWLEAALDRVKKQVNRDELKDDTEKLSYDLYLQQLEDYVTLMPKHKTYLCCVNRLEGPQEDLPLMAASIPLRTPRQRSFYLDFLKAIPTQLEQVTELLQEGIKEGRTPPQVSLGGVVDNIRRMIQGKLAEFTKPIEGLFLEGESDIQRACMEQIEGPITIAFSKLADYLERHYVPNLRTEISAVKGYPNGEEYYNACLSFHTTTNMTPEQVHQLGLEEVKRCKDEMNTIAAQEGYEGRLEEYLEHLRTSEEYAPASGTALTAHYRDIVGRIGPELLKLFYLDTLPRMPVQIVEKDAPTAPAAYYLAGSTSASAPRPGMFYVNTSVLPSRRTYECEALALHEAIPGHHTQLSIQIENDNLPDFRRCLEDRRYFEAPCRFPLYTSYIEGWGLHSETLGHELGLYKRPVDKFGQLTMEALRACRLVVDTGMHALGWSFDQALQYMLDNTAMGAHDARQEVARYITWPGQATAYKVGERFLHKLRTMAETELGDQFDPRKFYDVVLQCGPIPLAMLEILVKEYIEAEKKAIAAGGKDEAGSDTAFLEGMTFATWCKCCAVPGSCFNLQ